MSLTNGATKGRSGRVIPLHPDLKAALVTLYAHETEKGRVAPDAFVVTMKKGSSDAVTRSNSVQFLFKDWFAKLGFKGASSHSGTQDVHHQGC